MKNHLFCIQELLARGEEQELSAYLEDLNTRLFKNAGDISLGNDIADAICWEKARLAEEKGIRITADGKISSKAEILPADICTIFANALDNALEDLEDSGLVNPWIHIGIQNQGNLLCLVFENPVTDSTVLPAEGKTSKNPKHHQGLGLSNIRQAAEKYQGDSGQRSSLRKTAGSFVWKFFYRPELSIHNKITAVHNKIIAKT